MTKRRRPPGGNDETFFTSHFLQGCQGCCSISRRPDCCPVDELHEVWYLQLVLHDNASHAAPRERDHDVVWGIRVDFGDVTQVDHLQQPN